MVVVIEQGHPNEGGLHTARALWVLASFYALGSAKLFPILYRAIRSPGPDDSAVAVSVVLILLWAFIAVHIITAAGARRQRAWARIVSRIIAFILFPVIPVGTGFALYILRNTRPDRWAPPPIHVDRQSPVC